MPKGGAKLASSGQKQAAVSRMIQVYSLRGHQIADIDPLGLMERRVPGVLKLDYLGLTEADMDTEFFTGGLAGTGNDAIVVADLDRSLARLVHENLVDLQARLSMYLRAIGEPSADDELEE